MRLERKLSSIPTATGGIARLACEHLRASGRPLAPVMSRAGLTIEEIADPKRRIDARAQVRLLELAAEDLGDGCLGLRLAQDFALGQIGLLYYVMASSDRLADALQSAQRFCAVNNEGVRLRVSLQPAPVIAFEYLDVEDGRDRQHTEFWLATLLRLCRTLTGRRLSPQRIATRHFKHPIPPDLRSRLGCAIEFGMEGHQIELSPGTGSLQVMGADTHLNKILLQYAHEALGRRERRPVSVRSRVEGQIAQLLPHGKANSSEVARRLGMSRRTLTRALAADGESFSGILDEFRRALAKRYLREKDLPVSRIAWLLGYREASSFTHAFLRWTQSTPRAFRKEVDAG